MVRIVREGPARLGRTKGLRETESARVSSSRRLVVSSSRRLERFWVLHDSVLDSFLGSFSGLTSSSPRRGASDGGRRRAVRGVPCTWRENRTVRALDEASNAGAAAARVRWCVGEAGAETGAEAGDASVSGDSESSSRSSRWTERRVVPEVDGAPLVTGGAATTATSSSGPGEGGGEVFLSSVSTVAGCEGCEPSGGAEGERRDTRT